MLLVTLAVSPVIAVAVMLPILCVMDPMGVWAYRKTWDRASMRILLPGALVGTVAGALTFHLLDDRMIRLLIGVISIAFSLDYVIRGAEGVIARKAGSRLVGSALGAMSGFTSFVIHAGLPPVAMYLLPRRLDKTTYVGTITVLFFIVNYAKIGPYIWLGLFNAENLATSLVLMPLAPLGMWAGIRVHKLISNAWFYRISYAAMFLLGAKLTIDGLIG